MVEVDTKLWGGVKGRVREFFVGNTPGNRLNIEDVQICVVEEGGGAPLVSNDVFEVVPQVFRFEVTAYYTSRRRTPAEGRVEENVLTDRLYDH